MDILATTQLNIINDLGVITFCAAVVTLIFYRFKMPVFLGYILSGLLISPNFLGQYSPVKNLEGVNELSDLGVIFLMFYIGIEFDLEKLKKTLGSSFLAIALQTVLLFFLGIQTASFLGWTSVQGIFLGALLSISSSMVTIAVLRNYNETKKPYAQQAIGVLIMEDILAIIMLVLLGSIAQTGSFNPSTALLIGMAILIFMVSVYYFGRLATPSIVKTLMRYANPELVTLCSVGLMMGISLLASSFHFSGALGAFLAGAIFSRSKLAEQIQSSQEPIRYLFCAVFFVSIGMLIQPKMLWDNILLILVLSLLVILFKVLSCWIGFLLAGDKPKDGFQASVAKSQIGEFSFIIATLGQTLGVTDSRLTTIAVGTSLVTIITTPLLLENSGKAFDFLSRFVPAPVKSGEKIYREVLGSARERMSKNNSLGIIKKALLKNFIYLMLVFAIFISFGLVLKNIQQADIPKNIIKPASLGVLFLSAMLCTPFLSTIVTNTNTITDILLNAFVKSRKTHPTINRMILFVHKLGGIIVILLFTFIFSLLLQPYIPQGWALYTSLGVFVLTAILLSRRLLVLNSKLENRFSKSFFSETETDEERMMRIRSYIEKFPWPINVTEVMLPRNSIFAGKTIADTKLRSETGASIVGMAREGNTFHDPSPETPLFPHDTLIIFGTKEQLFAAEKLMTSIVPEEKLSHALTTFEIQQIFLGKNSSLVGETLATADLRKKHGINVLGIQRSGEHITSPSPTEILRIGDILMTIGNEKSIQYFQSQSKD